MTQLSLFHKCGPWYKGINGWHSVSRFTLLVAMSGITLVCLFALAHAINSVAIPPGIDQLNLPKDKFEAEHNGLVMDFSKTTTRTKQASEGCSRTKGAFICNGNEAGKMKKTPTEDECAAYCWETEGCQFWTYFQDWCVPKTTSNCTLPYEDSSWGSRQCGAPTTTTVCQSDYNSYICAADQAGNATKTSTVAECAANCRATEGCKFWAHYGGHCVQTASNCTVPLGGSIWGSRECGAPKDAWAFNTSAPSFMSVLGKFILILS